MLPFGFFLALLAVAGAVRFHDLIPDGETHFYGVPVEKYVSSWNRLMEIGHALNGNTDSFVSFEDLDWDQENQRANPFLYQGDIVLNEKQLDYLVETYEIELAKKEGRRFSRLLSIGKPSSLWDPKKFPIPWTVNATNPPAGGAAAIRTALDVWGELTCVTFAENGTYAQGRLEFYSGVGCLSPVRNDNGFNLISIGKGCEGTKTIDHEVAHSLGLFHVQNRNDAGQYIDFLMQNVNANDTANFLPPTSTWMATTKGIPYDYGSAMQYDRFSFAKKKGVPTMLPKDRNYNTTLGQNFEIAFTDAMEINMMYCDHVCPNKLPCRRGGYTDPKDCTKCRCPAGFTGPLCQAVIRNPACGGRTSRSATDKYQTLSVMGQHECVFKLRAPIGKTIEIVLDNAEFQGEDAIFQSCQKHFVEIKYGAQFQTAGARFCPRDLYDPKVMQSLTNEVFVFYKSDDDLYNFSLRYKIGEEDDEKSV